MVDLADVLWLVANETRTHTTGGRLRSCIWFDAVYAMSVIGKFRVLYAETHSALQYSGNVRDDACKRLSPT